MATEAEIPQLRARATHILNSRESAMLERQREGSVARAALTDSPRGRDYTDFLRRFDPSVLAFRIGAVVLGTAGCILGAWMPYSHPLALTLSILWWGVFIGCLGGSLGALVCVLAERAPAPVPAGCSDSPGGANRARTASREERGDNQD